MSATAITKKELGDLHSEVALKLSSVGQRYTEGRRQVVEALAKSVRPIDMYAILRESPDLPQSSAYRTLSALSSVGVVRRIAGTDESGYFELSEQLIGGHHHHALCNQCGRVVDIDSSPRLEQALADAIRIAGKQTGFTLDSHRIDFVGLCKECS